MLDASIAPHKHIAHGKLPTVRIFAVVVPLVRVAGRRQQRQMTPTALASDGLQAFQRRAGYYRQAEPLQKSPCTGAA